MAKGGLCRCCGKALWSASKRSCSEECRALLKEVNEDREYRRFENAKGEGWGVRTVPQRNDDGRDEAMVVQHPQG